MASKPSTSGAEPTPKRSLYQRYEDAKNGRNKVVPDEDLQKHVGMTRDELSQWSRERPGVAANRNAGSITAGPATGLGGLDTGSGYGGWGPDAGREPKYSPQKPAEQ